MEVTEGCNEIKLSMSYTESQFYYLRCINFYYSSFLMLALKTGGVEKPFVSDFLQVPTCLVLNCCGVVERIIFHLDAHTV